VASEPIVIDLDEMVSLPVETPSSTPLVVIDCEMVVSPPLPPAEGMEGLSTVDDLQTGLNSDASLEARLIPNSSSIDDCEEMTVPGTSPPFEHSTPIPSLDGSPMVEELLRDVRGVDAGPTTELLNELEKVDMTR